MVVVQEMSNTFWGVTLDDGKRYSQTLEGMVHVSMAALEPGSNKGDDGPVSVMIKHQNSEFVLCSLSSTHIFQQALDLQFNEGEEVTFYLKGKGTVHLTGYIYPGDDYHSDSDDDFMPSSFADSQEADSDSDESEEDESSDEESPKKGSKKRKAHMKEKKSKKAKVEIVDDEEDKDEDDSDMDDSQEKAVKTKSKKKKNKEKKDKVKEEKSAPITASDSQQSAAETGEKKKKKKKKKKNKQESQNASQQSSTASVGSSKGPRVVEGVTIEDLKVGHGPEATNGKQVCVYYTGKLANGKMFDAKIAGQPFKFPLGKKKVVKGWEIGVQGMKVGGKRKLTIPPEMGYGSKSVGDIPSNSTLHFEIELKAVN